MMRFTAFTCKGVQGRVKDRGYGHRCVVVDPKVGEAKNVLELSFSGL